MNARNEPVFVVAIGASTPVGRDAWSSAAAVRAGINGFVEHPYMIDSVGEPMRISPAPWLDIGLTGVERLRNLLLPCIDSVLEPVSERKALPSLALALGVTAPRPGATPGVDAALRTAIGQHLPGIFTAVATFPQGHASGLIALDVASQSIAQGRFAACVVAGVDSYLDPSTLEWLESNEQLHGAGRLNNAWGFIPGEAAGAILVCSQAIVDSLQLEPLAIVWGVGQSNEPNRIKTETVCVGEGLTAAFRQGLAVLPEGERITDVFCDMNGEPYRADEFAFATLRTKEWFVAASDFVAPAGSWGDVSAASGPLFVALAAVAGVKRYAKGSRAIAWASSEGGERAAAVIETRRNT